MNPSSASDAAAVCCSIGLIGNSPAHRRMMDELCRYAAVRATVLLEGATGTGKELAARALHYLGGRRGGPFVPVDCGALPETLFEGEVFGHARGAFTDARRDMRGLIAQAQGGTLFIDEIHTLALRSQASLLRFLQDHRYRSLGSEHWVEADVRVVVATNRSLQQGVDEGWFRADLFYRLNVASVRLPTLAERPEDVPLLVEAMLDRLAATYGAPPRRFGAAVLARLSSAPWPGNVRELENVVHRAFLKGDGERLELADDAAPTETVLQAFKQARAEVLANFEERYLRQMLIVTHGNVSEAARVSGKERRVFGRMMKRHGIRRGEFVKTDH